MQLIDTQGWTRADYIRFYTDVWGCPVIPVAKTKKPMVNWAQYQGRMPTKQELKDWFDAPCKDFKEPPWGLAIVLQHDLFSIDLDTDEVYKELRGRGAFKTGACLYKSARGYHVIMRSSTGTPRTVREHNPTLIAIDARFGELGIGADNNHLSIMPDTPGRYWIALYDQPLAVDYMGWLRKYLFWTPEEQYSNKGGGADWQPEILCPWHELDEPGHTPSLHPNLATGAYVCHGCDKQGTFSELVEYSNSIEHKLPQYIYDWVYNFKQRTAPVITPIEDEDTLYFGSHEMNMEDLPPGLIDGVAWRNNVGLLYAPPTQGKSSLATSLCSDIVMNEDIWGLAGWTPQKDLRVLLLDLENRPGESLAAVRLASGYHKDLDRFATMIEAGRGFDINNPASAQKLENNILRTKCDILIIDNLNRYTSRDIVKDDSEMKKVTNINRVLAKKYDILVIEIHHTGHLQMDNEGNYMNIRPKGGSSLRDDADFEFLAMRVSGKTNQLKLTVTKARSRASRLQLGDEFTLRYDKETTHIAPTTALHTMAMVKWLVKEHGVQECTKLLEVNKSTISRWLHGTREPQGTVKATIERLCKEGGYVPRISDVI